MKSLAILLLLVSPLFGAGYRTANFAVNAPTPEWAKAIGDAAEHYRKTHSVEWLGEEFPKWSQPCPITATIERGNGGATSFVFDRGQVFGWRMRIQGTAKELVPSVLQHEVLHTVFASYFLQPLPRWADEGACSTVETRDEVHRYEREIVQYLKTGRAIAFNDMMAMTQYPSDVMPLYAQGHSVAQWLIEQRGKQHFVYFLEDGLKDGNWHRAINDVYEFSDWRTMQEAWLDWIKAGRPNVARQPKQVVANYGQGRCRWMRDSCGNWIKVCDQPQQQPPTQRPPLTPIPPPVGNPPPTNPPATNNQPPIRGCDCGPKWTAILQWKNDINLEMRDRDNKIAALELKVTAQATAMANANQNLSQTVNNQIATYLSQHPVTAPDNSNGTEQQSSTLNFLDDDDQIFATAIITPGETSDVKLPPFPTTDDLLAELANHKTPIRVYFPDGRLAGETKTNIFQKDGSIDFTFNPRALLDEARRQAQ